MVGDWDNAEHELPTMVLKQEPTCLNESIESLLVLDRRSSQVDRGYLLRFFQSLGLDTVDDLKDVALFESLSDYLRTSLEAYQKSHGYEGLKSGAMRAILGCLLKRLEVGAPSKGIGTGQKMRYRRPCRKLPGLHGWPQCRGWSAVRRLVAQVLQVHYGGRGCRIIGDRVQSRPFGWQLWRGTPINVSSC